MYKISLFLISVVSLVAAAPQCPPPGFSALKNLDIERYISAPWYTQMQAVNAFQQKDVNYCVRAIYSPVKSQHHDRYLKFMPQFLRGGPNEIKIDVFNYANKGKVNGQVQSVNISAVITNPQSYPGELLVGQKFLPRILWGPYWVVAVGDEYEWAIVSGGPPKYATAKGKCKNGDGYNGSGLWFFTRAQETSAAVVDKMLQIASDLGYDTSVLNKVYQTDCEYRV